MPRLVVRFSLLLLLTSIALSPVSLSAQKIEENFATAPEQLRRIEPPDPAMSFESLESRADELRYTKAFADAIDYYKAALTKKKDARVFNKMGMTELMMMRYDEAAYDFQRSLKADKTYAEAYNNLGVIRYIKKDYRGAIKNYSKAISFREDFASYHSNLGTAYFARKKFDKAMLEYQRALEIDPTVFERRSRTGISAHMATDRDRAHYHYVIAKMFAVKGDSERCLLYLRKAMEDGYNGIDNVYRENEFAGIRKDPRFAELMRARPAAIPN